MKRRFSRYHILAIMQVIIAIGAIPTGISFIRDPSGVSSGLNIGLLDNSPFIDFYFPGLFLLVFLGFGNIAGAMISGLKIEVSGFLGLILGILLTGWILLQWHWIGLHSFLQPVMLILGIAEAVLGFVLLRQLIRYPEIE